MSFALKKLSSGNFSRVLLNSNFTDLENKINQDLLNTQNGSATMKQELDMNSHAIINLPAPVGVHSPVRLGDIPTGTATGTAGLTTIVDVSNLYSGTTVESALEEIAIQSKDKVDSISDLIALDFSLYADGDIIYVKDYHQDTEGGGGFFEKSSTTDKALHNGGSIIDPDIVFPTDWTNATQLTTWFTAGAGAGCWVKKNPERKSSTFGAKPSTNASKSIQQCIDVFDYVDDDENYIIDTTLNITKTSIVKNYKTYYIDTNISGVDYTGAETLSVSVTSINDVADTSLVGYTDTSTRVTVASTAGLSVGDKVVLIGDSTQRLFSTIYFISGNILYLSDKLTFTIGTNPLIKKYDDCSFIVKANFEYRTATTTATSFAVKLSNNIGGTVRNSRFTASGSNVTNAISCAGFEANILSNFLYNVAFGIDIFSGDKNSVKYNRVNLFNNAIRVVRGRANSIHDNFVTTGKDQSFSVGIELTGELVTYDKNCFNSVTENKVFNANHGVPGSGIGGIHLNFAAFNNIIKDNISQRNSFGIYLENSSSYNTISGNNCSYNDGYYGVGIELDWDAEYNTIVNNVCNYNIGSQTAAESAGIEIRGTVASGHASRGNIVSGNECNYNGLYGIWANGIELVITSNSCRDNGSLVELLNIGTGIKCEADSVNISDNTILQNVFDSRATNLFAQIAIDIDASSNIIMNDNNISAGYYSKHAIKLNGVCDKATINENNVVYNGAADRMFVCYGIDVSNTAKQIHVRNNIFDSVSNGTPDVEFTFTASLSLWGNTYPRSKSISLDVTSAAGRITPVDD